MRVISSFILVLVALSPASLRADVITESFFIDDPFFSGIPITDPGFQRSTFNIFSSSPDFTGQVDAHDTSRILAGSGDVRFIAQSSGDTRIDFDMGADLAVSTLNNATLTGSEIRLEGIETDDGADSFEFGFFITFLDGTTASNLTDVDLTVSNGNLATNGLDGGVIMGVLSGTDTSQDTDISFKGRNGKIIRSIDFRDITLDVAANELVIKGNRTINFTSVPEPCSGVVLSMCVLVGALRRRV